MRQFLNGKDEDGQDVEHAQPGRVRFTEICENKQILRTSAPGILPFTEVIQAFISSQMRPRLNDSEFREVFRAIEAFHDES